MASMANCISLLLLTTLFMSLQIHARDSQFFSKVTHVTIPTTTTTNKNAVEETELSKKEEPVNKPEQEPSFMPETESSYGLYGHESGQFAPTTTTTSYKPYKTEPDQHTDKYPNRYYSYNNDAYNTKQNEFTNTKLTGTGYNNNNYYYNNNNNYKTDAYGRSQNEFNSMVNQNNNNYRRYDHNNAANDREFDNNKNANSDRYFYDNYATKNTFHSNNNNAASNRYNVGKQGMSDTRFMEGGKYFYDINSEKYDSSLHGESYRGVNSRGWENNRGYFGNNNNNNNAKSYENNNSFEGYQNQEFEEEPEEFEP